MRLLEWTHELRRGRWALPFALILTLILGVTLSWRRSLWLDEVYSLMRSEGAFNDVLAINRLAEANPPLYYLTLWAWRGVAGDSILAVRGLSVLCALLAIVLCARLGELLHGSERGRGAATLLAISGVFVYFTHEARAYMLALVLSLAQALIGTRLLLAPPAFAVQQLGLVIAYGWLTWLAGSTVYYAWLGTTAQILAFALAAMLGPTGERWRSLRRVALLLVAGVIGLVIYLPEMLALARKTHELTRLVGPAGVASGLPQLLPELAWQDAYNRWFAFAGGFQWAPLGTAAVWIILAGWIILAVTAALGCQLGSASRRPAAALSLGLALFPWVLLALVPFRPHRFEGKHLIFALPWFCLAMVALEGPHRSRWRWAALLSYGLLQLLSIVGQFTSEKEPWREVWQQIAELQPGDLVLVTPPYVRQPLLQMRPLGAPELLVAHARDADEPAVLYVRSGRQASPPTRPDLPRIAGLIELAARRGARVLWLENASNVAIPGAVPNTLASYRLLPGASRLLLGFAGANGSALRLTIYRR